MSGTFIAQLIPVIISPVLTRIYSPEHFGVFSLFLSIVSFLSVIVTGRYELAIMIPAEEDKAKDVVTLTLIITAVGTVISGILILIFGEAFLSFFNLTAFPQILWFIPATVFFTGFYQIFNYWENRLSRYRILSINRILRSVITSVLSIYLIYFVSPFYGLIIAYFTGLSISTIFLGFDFLRNLERSNFSSSKLKSIARRFVGFPKYMLPAHTLNTASSNLPMMFITSFFGVVFSGYFALINRVVIGPMSIITSSYADVFRQQASKLYAEKGEFRQLYLKTAKMLFAISVGPILILILIAPFAFKFIFGDEWAVVGEYARIMAVMFLLQFIANPLASAIIITEKQKIDLIWQIFLFVFSNLSIFIGYYFSSFKLAIILFTVVYSLMYIISFCISFHYSGGEKGRTIHRI